MRGRPLLLALAWFAMASSITAAGGAPTSKTYTGVLSLTRADGIETGRLDQADGACLGVSLPASVLTQLRSSGPRRASVTGILFEVPEDIEVAFVRVSGRLIGFRQCSNQYVFAKTKGDIVLDQVWSDRAAH